MEKCIFSLLFIAVMLLQGCQSIPNDEKAYATSVVITEKEDKSTLFTKIYRYKVKDDKGRHSVVISYETQFNVGECATLWRSYSSKNKAYRYYPRLAEAGENCKLIKPEPQRENYFFYQFRIDHQKNYKFYSYKLDTWLDLSVGKLIQSWGTPSGSYRDANGVEYITYKKGYAETISSYNGYNQYMGSYTNQYWCNTTFTIVDGNVFDYTWEGNDCS